MQHVADQLDGRPDGDGTGEHRVRRAHRLVRKSFRHSDNRLGDHLGALYHLPLVLPGPDVTGGLRGEPVGSVGPRVEQIEQGLDRPLRLIRILGNLRQIDPASRSSSSRLSVTL